MTKTERGGLTAEKAREDLWEASARRDRERRRRKIRAEWFGVFSRMAESHARIAEDYERRAEELCREATEGGKGAA